MNKLEIVGQGGNDLLVKSPDMKASVRIEDTFAEMLQQMETSPENALTPATPSFFK